MEKLLENESLRKERKNGDRAEMNLVMDMEWMESEPPPVSIEDCTVVGTTDRGLNSTNHMPEVGGSRNR